MVSIATTCFPISLLCKSMNYPNLMTFLSFGTLFLDHNDSQLFVMPQFTITERQFLAGHYLKSYRYGRNNVLSSFVFTMFNENAPD